MLATLISALFQVSGLIQAEQQNSIGGDVGEDCPCW